MAAIDDLIRQVPDDNLRRRLQREAENLARQKRFGLVYEEHIPESVLLPGVAIRRGSTVARREGKHGELFCVEKVENGQALCRPLAGGDMQTIPTADLVAVARFGEAVYPYLQPIDSISTADEADPWHALIEADNYHALQLLDYLYHGKVDCIYIDPPYNSGARDWKYNNDYVDSSDQYRHSKWLSMMEKRLRLAKRLLNPKDSVLIVTIDEKEYLHLGCLLEEMFPEARMQMVSSVINPSGVSRGKEFYRTDEYIYVVKMGDATPCSLHLSESWLTAKSSGKDKLRWRPIRRQGNHDTRQEAYNQFYPIYLSQDGKRIEYCGSSLQPNETRPITSNEIYKTLWPIKPNLIEGCWQISQDTIDELKSKGYIRIRYSRKWGYVPQYLAEGERKKVENGQFPIIGYDDNGTIITADSIGEAPFIPGTQWRIPQHSARDYGSTLLSKFLGKREFPFPKSLYAVHDTLRFFVANKPDALILDFFAGSGTTLHAVNLLNKEDGCRRRCIMVTNNEVSDEEAKQLSKQGYKPGDDEWERLGIARYVTWPRTTCSIKGVDINNQPIKGEYLTCLTEEKAHKRTFRQLTFYIPQGNEGTKLKKQIVMLLGKDKLPQSKVTDNCSYIVDDDYPATILFDDKEIAEWLDDIEEHDHLREFYIVTQNNKLFKRAKERIEEMLGDYTTQETVKYPMEDGFRANVEYFKLGFLDKNAVSLGRQFRQLLPLLWLKAGAKGKRPVLAEGDDIPAMIILPASGLAVLTDENRFTDFAQQIERHAEIGNVFIVTDSAAGFTHMNNELPGRKVYQLYKDYLENFTINQQIASDRS